MAGIEVRHYQGDTTEIPYQSGIYEHREGGHIAQELAAEAFTEWGVGYRRGDAFKEDEQLGIDGWLGRYPIDFKYERPLREQRDAWNKITREYRRSPSFLDQTVLPLFLPPENLNVLARDPKKRFIWVIQGFRELIRRLDTLDQQEQLGQKLAEELEENLEKNREKG
jgi:hypothetical protein